MSMDQWRQDANEWLDDNILPGYLEAIDPAKVKCPEAFGHILRDGFPADFDNWPEARKEEFYDGHHYWLSWFCYGPPKAGKTRAVALLVEEILLGDHDTCSDQIAWHVCRRFLGRLGKARQHDPDEYEDTLKDVGYLRLLILDEIDHALTLPQVEILRDVLEVVRGRRVRLLATSNFSLAQLEAAWRDVDPAGKAIARLRDIVTPVRFDPAPAPPKVKMQVNDAAVTITGVDGGPIDSDSHSQPDHAKKEHEDAADDH